MSTESAPTETPLSQFGEEELRKSWGWFLALGIALVILGMIALGAAALFSVAAVILFGVLMIVGGVMEAAHALMRRQWSGFFIDLLLGILYVVVGFMLVANPAASAVALTLLIAAFLIFGGIFRIVAAIATRYPHWGWVLFNGVIGLLLGILIWVQWPLSGLWVIGLFIGIEMLFNGWTLIMLALAVKGTSTRRETAPPAREPGGAHPAT